MKYTMKICPWKNGQGWQEHDKADRTSSTLDGLFQQLEELETIRAEDDIDYSIDIYKNFIHVESFWVSDYENAGVMCEGKLFKLN